VVAVLNAALMAERCRSVFQLAPEEVASLRSAAAEECRNLLDQAARAAVRAGRVDVASDALSLLARAETGANHQVTILEVTAKPRIGFLP
jgi:hypothetical protein